MLRKDVVESVTKGKFHVYPVATIEQGIELLTGTSAGTASASEPAGKDKLSYPEGSVYGRVERRLVAMARDLRAATHPGKIKEKDEDDDEEEKETLESEEEKEEENEAEAPGSRPRIASKRSG